MVYSIPARGGSRRPLERGEKKSFEFRKGKDQRWCPKETAAKHERKKKKEIRLFMERKSATLRRTPLWNEKAGHFFEKNETD